ncbi:MAG: adenylate kinase [Alicyclobacillaceae bacterium]|uniref:adenylate kinase n=1 Tax=Alicyclobacillus sp. SP_1 TaxID=2942475 RepID=UPI0021586E24|nr:adenylate kinase [Alicyclobacillus sp. SP_1]MCY0887410.1 adenylate kinase [Alicyclobacillaceae bacterium]MCY0895952.1 adenylate kinase [Alicyclobacillaceae bacterium]
MQIMLLGLPGAGKGTQAARIQSEYGIAHISTGDMFRRAIASGSSLGNTVQEYLDSGRLVPDELTIEVVRSRLIEEDVQSGFLLDGFPRTLAQADALGELLENLQKRLDAVLYLHVPEDVLMRRLTGRRICSSCGATYHLEYNPPSREGICDVCGATLYQRPDDTVEAVSTRLEQYAQTAPLVNYYRDRSLLYEVDGLLPIDEVFHQVCVILNGLRK